MLDELKNQIFIADAELETLRSLAVQLGESDMELDLASVVLTIEKALHEKFDWELKAKAAGYQSVDMALTALSEVRAYSWFPLSSRLHQVNGLSRDLQLRTIKVLMNRSL